VTFRWSRDGAALTSRCVLCGLSTRALSETAIHTAQRAHDALTCQLRRAAAARAVATEVYVATYKPPPKLRALRTHCHDNHEYTLENTRMDGRGRRVCKTCEVLRVMAWRERQKTTRRLRVSPTFPAVSAAAVGIIEASEAAPDLAPEPPLNTPNERSIHMQNISASATPRQNLGGVA